jgi:putative ABC transport system ATP-binding protein
VEDGDFIAIKGKSGAGKSTLLHILGCIDDFDSGEYLLGGVDVGKLGDAKKARLRNRKIGFVLQDFALINQKSVLFNVMLPMYFDKTPFLKMRGKAKAALKEVGIEEQYRKSASQLSGGQQQRVAIARAIVTEPEIILADEPTGALDTQTSKQIMEILSAMNARGKTVIVVTHDDTVAGYCKKIVTLSDGEIKSE